MSALFYHRILFQFSTTKNTETQERAIVDAYIKEHCGSLRFICWSLEMAISFMREHYPMFAGIFEQTHAKPIVLCDFFRYVLMYHYGGVYTDIDFIPIRGFESFLAHLRADMLYSPRRVNEPRVVLSEEWYNSMRTTKTIHNGILISLEPFHPFWLKLMQEVYQDISVKGTEISTNDAVYAVSGPKKLCKFYEENEKYFTDVCVLPHYYFCPYLSYEENGEGGLVANVFNNAQQGNVVPTKKSRWVFINVKEHARLFALCPVSYFVNVYMNTGSMWKD